MTREPPIIDMLPDGSFREQTRGPMPGGPAPGGPVLPLQAKLMLTAIVVTAVGISIAVAAVAIWVVSMLLPVIVLAAAAAYGLYRFQRWQLRRRHPGLVQNAWQPGRFR